VIALITELIKYVNTLDGVCGRINIDSKEKKIIYILEFEILENELDSFKEKIKSYEIDKDSISLNPMGGIMFRVFINNNKEMYVNFLIDKDPRYDDGRLVNEGGGPSQEFEELISGVSNE